MKKINQIIKITARIKHHQNVLNRILTEEMWLPSNLDAEEKKKLDQISQTLDEIESKESENLNYIKSVKMNFTKTVNIWYQSVAYENIEKP